MEIGFHWVQIWAGSTVYCIQNVLGKHLRKVKPYKLKNCFFKANKKYLFILCFLKKYYYQNIFFTITSIFQSKDLRLCEHGWRIFIATKKNQTLLKTYMRNSELMTSWKLLDLKMFRKLWGRQNTKASDTHITIFHNQITDNCNYIEKIT